MDNFSQENEEKELETPIADTENISDIQFEEPNIQPQEPETPQEEPKAEQNAADELVFEETEENEQEEPALASEFFEDEISDEELTKTLESQFNDIKAEDTLMPKSEGSKNNLGENQPNSKKYVIYIDSENVDFIESLSINERKTIINDILKEQDIVIKKQRQNEARNRYIKHLTVASFTFIICFPLLFILVNKSLEVSINNYQTSRENFVKLYKEQGKIKPSEKNILGE